MRLTSPQYQHMTDYLRRLYDVPVYERHGVPHPIVWHRATDDQRNTPDRIFGTAPRRTINRDDCEIYDYGYLQTLQNSKRNLFNGTTFALKRFVPRTLRIDANFGTYFDAIATSYALENEIIQAQSRTRGALRLPLRTQYHRAIPARESLTSGTGRSAPLGGGTLIVYNQRGTYHALVNQRGSQQAARPNALHVLPAYIVQPMGTTMHPREWSITHHLYREFLEELFGLPESDTITYEHPALDDYQQMQAEGLAQVYLLGVSFNLMTLRVEISTLMLIRDPQWWERVNTADTPLTLDLTESDRLLPVPLSDDDAILNQLPDAYYLNMPPQALTTLWAGIDLARDLLS